MTMELNKETCIKALELRLPLCMTDSTDSYEENVKKVKEMADITHSLWRNNRRRARDMSGDDENPEGSSVVAIRQFYTGSGYGKRFRGKNRRRRGDCLKQLTKLKLPPKLDFERIRTIANTIDLPLCTHGGSGLTDNDFRAIQEGISKIKYFYGSRCGAA